MSDFRRRLPNKCWDAVKGFSSSAGGWWPDLLAQWAPSGSQGALRLGVRDNYMNFYSMGQSIAKISFGRGGRLPNMEVHEKYMEDSNGNQRYIKFDWGHPGDVQHWICKSSRYSNKEKRCIDKLIAASPKVIDLEMGLPAFGERKSAARIDIVALEGTPEDIRLVFWEAKMIGDSRLRSREGKPKVFKQIKHYRTYLSDTGRRRSVATAYRECCKIICELHEIAGGNIGPIDTLIREAAKPNSNLTVEQEPRLLIFDEGKKQDEAAWEKHLQVLCKRLSVTILKERPIRDPLESLPRLGK